MILWKQAKKKLKSVLEQRLTVLFPQQKSVVFSTTLLLFFKIYFYPASATTSFTSGIILFIIPSTPTFKVIIEEGQPEQLP